MMFAQIIATAAIVIVYFWIIWNDKNRPLVSLAQTTLMAFGAWYLLKAIWS